MILPTRRVIPILVLGLLTVREAVGADSLSLGATFDADLVRDLPGTRRPWSILETADVTAILDRIDNGGLYTGEAEIVGVHGASWTQVSYRLGDLDVTDPDLTGTPLFLPDPAMFDGFELVSGLMPADLAGPGSVVRFVPRRPGGESLRGMAAGHLLPAGLQAEARGSAPALARYDSMAGGRFGLDGPLAKDRLRFLLSGSATRVRRFELADPRSLQGSEAGLLSHLIWTPRPSDEVRWTGTFQHVIRPHAGRVRFGGAGRESGRFLNVQATWARSGKRPWALSGGYAHGALDADVPAALATPTVERLLAGPIPRLFVEDGARRRGTLSARIEPLVGQRHHVRAGVSASWTGSVTRPAGPRTLTAETVDGLPARVWDFGFAGPESRWRAFEVAAHGADRVRWGRLLLEGGLRFEHTRGSAASGPVDVRWTALSPRLSGRVDLTPGGALAFRSGYARYRGRLPLHYLAYGDPAAAHGEVYRWLDRDGNGLFAPGEQGPLVARVGPGGAFSAIDADLAPPTTEEVVVGVEARFLRTWTFSFLGIHRRESRLVESVNVGVPASSYTVRLVPDASGDIEGPDDDQLLPLYNRRPESFGQDRYRLTNSGENVLHEGVEAVVRGTVAKRLHLFFGGTASKSEGPDGNRGFRVAENDQGVLGERLENPNATTFSRGRLFFDRAYTLNLGATWRAPGDVRGGAIARYQDGQPFSRLVIATGLDQGPEAVQSVPNGRHRFTYTFTLDARVEKGFRLGRVRLAPVLEVFNLLGTANEWEEDVTTGPSFRTVTVIQPPRAVVLELRADF